MYSTNRKGFLGQLHSLGLGASIYSQLSRRSGGSCGAAMRSAHQSTLDADPEGQVVSRVGVAEGIGCGTGWAIVRCSCPLRACLERPAPPRPAPPRPAPPAPGLEAGWTGLCRAKRASRAVVTWHFNEPSIDCRNRLRPRRVRHGI